MNKNIKAMAENLERQDIIEAIKALDKLDEIRINYLKNIYEHHWYEESIKDELHKFFCYNIVCLREAARLKFGKDWSKKDVTTGN